MKETPSFNLTEIVIIIAVGVEVASLVDVKLEPQGLRLFKTIWQVSKCAEKEVHTTSSKPRGQLTVEMVNLNVRKAGLPVMRLISK